MNRNRSLPTPQTAGAGKGAVIFLAAAAVIALAAIWWWLSRQPEEREELRDQAADVINRGLSETPLAGLGDILRTSPPPLPPEVLNPPTLPGTLSGRQVAGTVGSPVELARQEELKNSPLHSSRPELVLTAQGSLPPPEEPAAPQFSNVPLPPVTEDSRIPPDYLRDFAGWLASRYKTGAEGGTLLFSVQNVNSLLAGALTREARSRDELLRYAFQPSMVNGLYQLYVERFMENLDAAALSQGFNPEENRQFHLALAGRVLSIAAAVDGVLKLPEPGAALGRLEELAQKAVEINTQLANAVNELDELRQAGASPQQLQAAQLRVDGAFARFRRAEEESVQARQHLADAIRKISGQVLDDDSLIFLAAWTQRRLEKDKEAKASLDNCLNILRDFARRCAAGSE